MTRTPRRLREAGQAGTGSQKVIDRAMLGRQAVAIARRLRRSLLRNSAFRLINGFSLSRGDIDHIVLGPTGIFAIETKGHRGAVRVSDGIVTINGRRPKRDPLKQARRAARELRGYLSRIIGNAWVQPVVCFAGGRIARSQVIDSVLVTKPEHLCYLIRRWKSRTQPLSHNETVRAFTMLGSNTRGATQERIASS